MLPITWNEVEQMWEVKDKDGKSLWRGKTYADAAQFVEDYLKQAAIRNTIAVGSARG